MNIPDPDFQRAMDYNHGLTVGYQLARLKRGLKVIYPLKLEEIIELMITNPEFHRGICDNYKPSQLRRW